MLTLTTEASQAIQTILDSEQAPEGAVFRISSQETPGPEPQTGFAVSVTDTPEPEDQVVEDPNVEVRVEPEAAELLDDKELDATIADGQVNFSLNEQAA